MSDFLQLFQDPHARHSILVHAPITLCALGVLPLLFLACTGFRSTALRLFCVVWFVIGSVGAGLAANAGEEAEEHVEEGVVPLTAAAEKTLHDHETLGDAGWIWPLIPAALVALTLVPAGKARGEGKKPRRGFQIGAGSAAIAAAAGVGVWVGVTAHHGGTLVYVHGVGVPQQTGHHAGGAEDGAAGAATHEHGEEGHEHDDD